MAEQSLPLSAQLRLPPLALALRRGGPTLGLAALALLAGILDFWALTQNSWGNDYYAAAVRSMTESWHNFFYVSFDPTGWVTVDKPPLAFWIEAASAKLFGFSSLSILGPSALAGAVSVVVLSRTVMRVWGVPAGLIAGLVLALTPVSLIANRSNDPDGILVLMLVAAAWAAVRALESGRLRWVVLTALFVGLGFNAKMLAAFLVLPGLALAYLLAGPRSWRVRLLHLGAAGLVTLVVSGAWIAAVDLTPAGQRPWVDSTQTNSELDLAIGYNGLQRIFGGLLGNGRGRGGAPRSGLGGNPGERGGVNPPPGFAEIPAQYRDAFQNAAASGFGGPSGAMRLLAGDIATQGSWLFPLAALGLLSALLAVGLRRRGPRLGALILFGGWLVVSWAVYSFQNGIFHPYYISELAPATAALVGIGAVSLWRDAISKTWRIGLPVIALTVTAAFEIFLLSGYPGQLPGWDVALVALTAVVALALLLAAAWDRLARQAPVMAGGALAVGVIAVLVAPTWWAGTVLSSPEQGAISQAGPRQAAAGGPGPGGGQIAIIGGPGEASRFFRGPGGGRGLDGGVQNASKLLAFLAAHAGGYRYQLATPNSQTAASLIITSGRPIISLGGFSGSDPIVSAAGLAELVEQGQIRYFLLPGGGERGFGGSQATAHVQTVCTPVPAREWGGTSSNNGFSTTLYDCAGKGPALAAAAKG